MSLAARGSCGSRNWIKIKTAPEVGHTLLPGAMAGPTAFKKAAAKVLRHDPCGGWTANPKTRTAGSTHRTQSATGSAAWRLQE